MESNRPSLQYLRILEDTQGDMYKLEEIRFKELQPYLNEILKIRQKTIPARIWNPKTNEAHNVKEKSPNIVILESQITLINEKFQKIYEENRAYNFIR